MFERNCPISGWAADSSRVMQALQAQRSPVQEQEARRCPTQDLREQHFPGPIQAGLGQAAHLRPALGGQGLVSPGNRLPVRRVQVQCRPVSDLPSNRQDSLWPAWRVRRPTQRNPQEQVWSPKSEPHAQPAECARLAGLARTIVLGARRHPSRGERRRDSVALRKLPLQPGWHWPAQEHGRVESVAWSRRAARRVGWIAQTRARASGRMPALQVLRRQAVPAVRRLLQQKLDPQPQATTHGLD